MTGRRVGLWLVGAYGGIAATVALGLSAMGGGRSGRTGLVTDLPEFAGLGLPEPGDFVIGGHDVRRSSFADAIEEMGRTSETFAPAMVAAASADLEAASARVRPGTTLGSGPAIARMATWPGPAPARTAAEAVARIAADLDAFVAAERIDHLIVMNLASTEPPFLLGDEHQEWAALDAALATGGPELLPSSSLYALAAIRDGHTYINFTPSLGASIPALHALADRTGALHAGKDGKTGETLLKTVLAPMFAARNFRVMSWVGHNIFGNRDAETLDDPVNKSSKLDVMGRGVAQILGYRPRTVDTLEFVPDLGAWKTAWDHIHFRGFLDTSMVLQFTWQGCDTLLAAPLVIDLARLADLEKVRGGRGLMRHLAPFFKAAEGVDENDFFKQTRLLQAHLARHHRDPDSPT